MSEHSNDVTAANSHVLALAERFAPYTRGMREAMADTADVGIKRNLFMDWNAS